jgi:CRISPR system Cascade subunit CasC
MFLELHIIQNFAPSNLNRDDTGSPKDCEFGSYRRARVSSQCLKRAIRRAFQRQELVPAADRAIRSKRLLGELVRRLCEQGKAETEATAVVEQMLGAVGLPVTEGKTQYLLYLAQREIDGIVALCLDQWAALAGGAQATSGEGAQSGKAKSGKAAKKSAKGAAPDGLRSAFASLLDGGRAVDLALFGRMLADMPEKNVDGACQIAHALSTHRVNTEFDYYTAVDDLKPEDTSGADMIGTVEFNSACFYRYANLDLRQLLKNLRGDSALALKAARAFVQASIEAVPSGKQHSMGAQNPPSFVAAVLRQQQLWSLANAFAKPVRPNGDTDLIEASIKALDGHWGKLCETYGGESVVSGWVSTLEPRAVEYMKQPPLRLVTIPDLLQSIPQAIQPLLEEKGSA